MSLRSKTKWWNKENITEQNKEEYVPILLMRQVTPRVYKEISDKALLIDYIIESLFLKEMIFTIKYTGKITNILYPDAIADIVATVIHKLNKKGIYQYAFSDAEYLYSVNKDFHFISFKIQYSQSCILSIDVTDQAE